MAAGLSSGLPLTPHPSHLAPHPSHPHSPIAMATNKPSLKQRFQRYCPNCSDLVNVRRHVCNCGYSFFEARLKAEQEKEARQEEMGKRAANYKILSRSLTAIKKHSSKLRGGGYHIATVYYKACGQRTIKSILPGSGLSKETEKNLIDWFYLAHTQEKQANDNSSKRNAACILDGDEREEGAQDSLMFNISQPQEDSSINKNKRKTNGSKGEQRMNSNSCDNVCAGGEDETSMNYQQDENCLPDRDPLHFLEIVDTSSCSLDQAHSIQQEDIAPIYQPTKRKRREKNNHEETNDPDNRSGLPDDFYKSLQELQYKQKMKQFEEEIAKLQASYDACNKGKKPRTAVLQYSGSSSGRKSRAKGTPSNPFPVNSLIVESPMPAAEMFPKNYNACTGIQDETAKS
ncbi:uncharacterized protein [Procambarus clarkii]|uniref:uncharacterized protein isoform X2 n=1 Tax=Procambarus clarkii TaxID=6728 RepID=UPI0037432CE5